MVCRVPYCILSIPVNPEVLCLAVCLVCLVDNFWQTLSRMADEFLDDMKFDAELEGNLVLGLEAFCCFLLSKFV